MNDFYKLENHELKPVDFYFGSIRGGCYKRIYNNGLYCYISKEPRGPNNLFAIIHHGLNIETNTTSFYWQNKILR